MLLDSHLDRPVFQLARNGGSVILRPVLIKALYVGLVISVIAVLGVAVALYVRVRKHLAEPEKHLPEHDDKPGEPQI